MKKIMIIAGGQWQVPLVKKAKEMGLYVINTNPFKDSPAFKYADAHEISDVLDIDKNLEIAEKYLPEAIVTDQSDIAVPTVAYISEKLGLKGIGVEKAKLFTNKYLMRDFCKNNDYPTPDYMLCETSEQALDFFKKYKKIIIKPLDSQSSRGVFTIETEDELKKLFEETRNFSNSEKMVLAEEFIEGTEFTVDGIIADKKHSSLAISQKKHYKEFPNVASELYFTQTNLEFDYDILKKQHNSMIEDMGLPYGLTHAEYIFSNGKFYLVEVAARGGGTNISGIIVKYMSGIDNMELLLRLALGEDVSAKEIEYNIQSNKYCILKFFDFPTGKVKKIDGEDFLKNNSNILDYRLNFKVGDVLHSPVDDSKRVGHYIACAESEKELQLLINEVNNKVRVEF